MKGYSIKTTPDPRQPVDIKVYGSLTFDEALELNMFCLRAFLNQTFKILIDQSPEDMKDEQAARAALYDKAVVTFSLVMDEFFPEAKDIKHDLNKFKEYLEAENGKN